MAARRQNYYSAHNIASKVSLTIYASVMTANHGSVVRIFMALSWELYCQQKSKQALEQMGRQSNGVIRIFVGHSHLSNIVPSFTLDYVAQFSTTRNAITSGLLKTMWIQQAFGYQTIKNYHFTYICSSHFLNSYDRCIPFPYPISGEGTVLTLTLLMYTAYCRACLTACGPKAVEEDMSPCAQLFHRLVTHCIQVWDTTWPVEQWLTEVDIVIRIQTFNVLHQPSFSLFCRQVHTILLR